jgi:hypothetical protein
MPPTLAPTRETRKYGTSRPVSHESRAIHAAARRMGLQPSTVGQMVRSRGVHIQTATLIEAAILLRDDPLFQRLTAPLLAAIDARPIREFSPQLVHEVQAADLAEDISESAFLAQRSPETRHAWLLRLRQQHVLSGDLIRSLEGEEGRRA